MKLILHTYTKEFIDFLDCFKIQPFLFFKGDFTISTHFSKTLSFIFYIYLIFVAQKNIQFVLNRNKFELNSYTL